MARSRSRLAFALVLVATPIALPAAQAVTGGGRAGAAARLAPPPRTWVVDASGGGQFTDLPPAVAVAHDGDLILVRDGSYSALVLDDLGVTVLAEGGAATVDGTSSVSNLPAGEEVVLKGLTFLGPDGWTLRVADARGSVWLEDVRIGTSAVGLDARDSEGIVLVRTEVFSTGTALGTSAGALQVTRSSVHVFDSTLTGSNGLGLNPVPGDGVAGAVVADGFLYAARSLFQGGSGSDSVCNPLSPICTPRAGVGGDGLVVSGASLAVEVDSAFVAGANGSGNPLCSLCGALGIPADVVGPLTRLGGPARTHTVESPIRGGTSYLLHAEGVPGDTAFSLYAEEPAPAYVATLLGPLLVEDPLVTWREGVIPASGVLERSYPVPTVLGAYERLFVQGVFVDPTLQGHVAGGTALYVLP